MPPCQTQRVPHPFTQPAARGLFCTHAGLTNEQPHSTHTKDDMTDTQIEQEIQAKGLTAPRITPADIEANIASEHYFTAADGERGAANSAFGYSEANPLGLLTFCVLVMRNGFTVTGESACASPENFDAEVGRKIARANAVNKIWPLMGYELRSKLAGA